MLSWQDKLALKEPDAIETFLQENNCGCANNCINKIAEFGEQGINMLCQVRGARLSGLQLYTQMNTHLAVTTFSTVQLSLRKISRFF